MKNLLPSVLLLSAFSSGFVVAGDDDGILPEKASQPKGVSTTFEKSEWEKLNKMINLEVERLQKNPADNAKHIELLKQAQKLMSYINNVNLSKNSSLEWSLSWLCESIHEEHFFSSDYHLPAHILDKVFRTFGSELDAHPEIESVLNEISLLDKIKNATNKIYEEQLDVLAKQLLEHINYNPPGYTISSNDILSGFLSAMYDEIKIRKYASALDFLYPILHPRRGPSTITEDGELSNLLPKMETLLKKLKQ